MNTWRILRAQDIVNKARQRLGYYGPIDKAVIPAGMPSWRFEGLIAKIETNEAYIQAQVLKGLRPKSASNK